MVRIGVKAGDPYNTQRVTGGKRKSKTDLAITKLIESKSEKYKLSEKAKDALERCAKDFLTNIFKKMHLADEIMGTQDATLGTAFPLMAKLVVGLENPQLCI